MGEGEGGKVAGQPCQPLGAAGAGPAGRASSMSALLPRFKASVHFLRDRRESPVATVGPEKAATAKAVATSSRRAVRGETGNILRWCEPHEELLPRHH